VEGTDVPDLKHLIKCRGCGHVFDVRVCSLQQANEVLREIMKTMGLWSITGRKCPKCGTAVSLGPQPTIEIDIEEL
jgi:hypothetical protein